VPSRNVGRGVDEAGVEVHGGAEERATGRDADRAHPGAEFERDEPGVEVRATLLTRARPLDGGGAGELDHRAERARVVVERPCRTSPLLLAASDDQRHLAVGAVFTAPPTSGRLWSPVPLATEKRRIRVSCC
jgi:hypothetical protein